MAKKAARMLQKKFNFTVLCKHINNKNKLKIQEKYKKCIYMSHYTNSFDTYVRTIVQL